MATWLKSAFGQYIGVGHLGEVLSRAAQKTLNITHPAVDASVTISAEATDVRTITIQLKDAFGRNLAVQAAIEVWNYTSSAMTALSAGGSTGLATTTNGITLSTLLTKSGLRVQTDATGKWVGTYTDTGTVAGYLGIRLPNGVLRGIGVLTNA